MFMCVKATGVAAKANPDPEAEMHSDVWNNPQDELTYHGNDVYMK